MTHWPLLSLLIWLPILGGVFTMMAGNSRPQAARWIALAFSVATFLLCIPLFAGFDLGSAGMQYVVVGFWIPAYDIQYHLGAALAKSGDKPGARKQLEQLLAANKEFPQRAEAQALLTQL